MFGKTIPLDIISLKHPLSATKREVNEARARHISQSPHAPADGGDTESRCQPTQRNPIEPYQDDYRAVAEVAEAIISTNKSQAVNAMLKNCATYTPQGEVPKVLGLPKLTKAPNIPHPSTTRASLGWGSSLEHLFRTIVHGRTINPMHHESIVQKAVRYLGAGIRLVRWKGTHPSEFRPYLTYPAPSVL